MKILVMMMIVVALEGVGSETQPAPWVRLDPSKADTSEVVQQALVLLDQELDLKISQKIIRSVKVQVRFMSATIIFVMYNDALICNFGNLPHHHGARINVFQRCGSIQPRTLSEFCKSNHFGCSFKNHSRVQYYCYYGNYCYHYYLYHSE